MIGRATSTGQARIQMAMGLMIQGREVTDAAADLG
jgi:hypothetical protein